MYSVIVLRLAWDAENDQHITGRHGITRDEVQQAINGDTLVSGSEFRNGELRTRLIGRTDAGRVVFVVLADVLPGTVRAVTAFPAKRKLRKLYERYLGGTR